MDALVEVEAVACALRVAGGGSRVGTNEASLVRDPEAIAVTVPRWLGPARLAGLPPVSNVLDLALAPVAPLVARWARHYQETLVGRARGDGRIDGDGLTDRMTRRPS